jgi:homoserine kinase type II
LGSRRLTKKDELKRVLSFYDLGELKRTYRVQQGVVNDNWRVETVQGGYFLKRRHPELRNAELIRAQHALTKHLRGSGFPAPAIIPTRRGETLLILDGEFYEIQEFIGGKPYEQNNVAHLITAATALGIYHAYVQNFTSQALCKGDRLYCPIVLTSNLSILSKDPERCQGSSFADFVEALAGHATDLSLRLSSFEQLSRLVIHGDYHAGNLIFKNDCIVGVVDYDKACHQPRVVELAEALIYFASPRPGKMEHLVYSGFLEWDRITSFLKHYACALRSPDKKVLRYISLLRPASDILGRAPSESAWLREDEVCALPDYIRAIWLCVSIEQILERRFQPSEVTEFLRELLALSDWPSTHRQRLIEAGHTAMRASEGNSAGVSSF